MVIDPQQIALTLPDIPRHVELRGMLLSDVAQIRSFEPGSPPNFVARHTLTGLVVIVGHPSSAAIAQVVRDDPNAVEVVAVAENDAHVAAALADWHRELAIRHILGGDSHQPERAPGVVGWHTPPDVAALAHVPTDVHADLMLAAAQQVPMVATFVNDHPVSFCYTGAETEGFWDIAIDTLPAYRRRGYAALCATFLIDYMQQRGKQSVWGAVVSNTPSLHLATKLGFVPADQIVLFTRY